MAKKRSEELFGEYDGISGTNARNFVDNNTGNEFKDSLNAAMSYGQRQAQGSKPKHYELNTELQDWIPQQLGRSGGNLQRPQAGPQLFGNAPLDAPENNQPFIGMDNFSAPMTPMQQSQQNLFRMGQQQGQSNVPSLGVPEPQPSAMYVPPALPPVAPMARPPSATLNEMSAYGAPQVAPTPVTPPIPSDLTQFQGPNGGTVAMPATLPGGRAAEDVQSAVLGKPTLDANGYTPQEARQVDQEMKIAEAKQGISARAIVSTLESQGMTEAEIRTAIGADENPNMTRGQAFKKLQEVQRKNKIQTSTSKIARQTERMKNKAEWNAEGLPVNDEATYLDMENELATTGDDPLGESLLDLMSDSDKRLIDNYRSRVSSGASVGDSARKAGRAVAEAKKKAVRNLATRTAKEEKKAFDTKQEQAQSLIKSREDRKRYQEESKLHSALQKDWATKYKVDTDSDETEKAKLALDAFQFSFNTQDDQIKAVIPDATPEEMVEIRKGLQNGYTLEQMRDA